MAYCIWDNFLSRISNAWLFHHIMLCLGYDVSNIFLSLTVLQRKQRFHCQMKEILIRIQSLT